MSCIPVARIMRLDWWLMPLVVRVTGNGGGEEEVLGEEEGGWMPVTDARHGAVDEGEARVSGYLLAGEGAEGGGRGAVEAGDVVHFGGGGVACEGGGSVR